MAAFLSLSAALMLAGGCGSSPDTGASLPDYDKALADAPPALAAVYDDGNEVLEGGTGEFDRRLAGLEGTPVVVNAWASWCVPCRAEFVHFQQVVAESGTEVAFLGVLANDSIEAGETFLRDNPLPYPSYYDPEEEIVAEIGNPRGAYPSTSYFDANGELVFTKIGQYRDQAELEADVAKYALGG